MIRSRSLAVATAMAAVIVAVPTSAPAATHTAQAAAKKLKTVTVCRRGCAYPTVQAGVDAVRRGGTVRVKPGTYVEGVVVEGRKKDGITIRGTRKGVVLQGKGAKDADGNPAQNGIFVDGADRVTLRRLTAKNYPANGFFARNCDGYTMTRLVAAFNVGYGLYAFNCKGGRMTHSTGYGHGDSAFYVGQTPPQTKPKRTKLDHLIAYENVLGYSGTNSRYVDITNGEWFNNGAGIVPNTLDSESFPPAQDSTIRNNKVFWNNFNYFKADSSVEPLPAATGAFNYPTGVGVVLLGTTGVTVTDNDIFGNFKWGTFTVSDPSFAPATTIDNTLSGNRMGAANRDLNGVDHMTEGSGRGNCYADNGAGATFDAGSVPTEQLYPACGTPRPANVFDPQQLGEIAGYLTQGETQEDSWVKHPHKAIPGREPIDGMGTE